MEPEPGEGLDAFLRRAAQVAAFGAAVGAAVGAARAARSGDTEEADGQPTPEPEERPEARRPEPSEEDEHPQQRSAQEQEAPEAEDDDREPVERPRQSVREEATVDEEAEEDEPEAEEPRGESPDGPVSGEAANIIRRALPQLEQLTGREPEGVLGVRRDDDGWRLTVEVVELPRVPSSTDVLATYEMVLDGDGDVREYQRTGRYIRGRGDAGEQ